MTARRAARDAIVFLRGALVVFVLSGLSPLRAGDAGAPLAPLTETTAQALLQGIIPAVEEIRGLRFRQPVKAKVVTAEEVRRYAVERLARFYPDRDLEVFRKAYELLGLVEPGEDLKRRLLDALEEQVAGFYDPATKTFYLLNRIPSGMAGVLMTHELTHALDDQHFDLDARIERFRGDEDLSFALGAVHEGCASLVMALYVAREIASGVLEAGDVAAMARLEGQRTEKLKALPAVFRRELLAGYMLGVSFLLRGKPESLLGGFPVRDAERAFREGPVSSEQILHPEKFWDPARRDDPRKVSLPDASRVLGRGWTLAGGDTLGELALGALVGAPAEPSPEDAAAAMDGSRWTSAAAAGWGGDRWQLWTSGSSAVLLLKTLWDTPADAEEFERALPRRADLSSQRRGSTVAIVAGGTGPPAAKLLTRLLK